MATNKTKYDTKLIVRVANGTTSNGGTSVRNLSYSRVKVNATEDELYAAGKAIAALQENDLTGIRAVETYDLTSST